MAGLIPKRPSPAAGRSATGIVALLCLSILWTHASVVASRSLAPARRGAAASAAGEGHYSAVIVDSDFGDWMDDPFALALLRATVGDALKLVLTTGTREAALLAAQLLLTGGAGGPLPAVGQGLAPPGNATRQPCLAGALDLALRPALEAMVLADGISAAATVVEAAAGAGSEVGGGGGGGRVLWLVIGPSTNAAAFATAYPELTPHVALGLMAGSSRPGIPLPWGNGCCTTPIVEFNVATDVQAARTVLATNWASPPSYAPIDDTHDSALRGRWFARLLEAAFPAGSDCRAEYNTRMSMAGSIAYCATYGCHSYTLAASDCGQGHPMASALLTTYLAWINEARQAGPASPAYDEAEYVVSHRVWATATPPLYDAFAVAQLLRPALFDVRRQRLAIADDGATALLQGSRGKPVDWGWECPHPEAVWEALMEPLLADSGVSVQR
eukprot:jgi/Tetstr1/441974/TSEL_030179.t1